jgi:hypothetical protein
MKALNGSLKLIAIAGLTLTIAAAGCSSDSDKNDGKDTGAAGESTAGTSNSTAGTSNSTAGTSNGNQGGDDSGKGGEASVTPQGGGSSDVGGATDGGAPPGFGFEAGGDTGAGGAPETGPAIAKFCNVLSYNQQDTTMVLVIGEGTTAVTFEADTGECVPIDCQEIPTGDDVLVEMFDKKNTSLALDSGTLTIKPGRHKIFYSEVEDFGDGDVPVWASGTVDTEVTTCGEITFEDVYSSQP